MRCRHPGSRRLRSGLPACSIRACVQLKVAHMSSLWLLTRGRTAVRLELPPNPEFVNARKQFVDLHELLVQWIARGREIDPDFVSRILQVLVGDTDDRPEREPRYRGVPLSEWIESL